MPESAPHYLKALGRRPLPDTIEVAGCPYTHRRTFKHDFFAATAMYEGDAGKVLLKVGRQASFLGMPFGLVGRLLTYRERLALDRLGDLEGVPKLLARWERSGLIREFIEGRPLAKGATVPDDFFDRLRALLAKIHERGMAYVDLEKCENVLVGEDGRPHLFDFQIAWYVPTHWGGEWWPMRRVRRWFQSGDWYHALKLQRRVRPDQLTPEQLAVSYRRPWHVRVHGVLTRPLLWVRRLILRRLAPRNAPGERGRLG